MPTSYTLNTGSAMFNGNVGIWATPDANISLTTNTAKFFNRIGVGCDPDATINLTTGSAKFTGKVGIGVTPDATIDFTTNIAKFNNRIGVGYAPDATINLTTGSAKFNGKVGIGVAPSSTYDLNTGSAQFSGNVGIGSAQDAAYNLTTNYGLFNNNVKVTGNIGIGTNPGTYKLDVAGSVRITNGTSRIECSMNDIIIDNTGYYGIAIYPEYDKTCNLGFVNKAFKYIFAEDVTETSDSRQKENIRDIENPLDKIMKIKPVKYDFKIEFVTNPEIDKDAKALAVIEKDRKDKIGFLAQDLQKILPEVVYYSDSTDVYGINYSRIIPVLVGAIQEQQLEIAKLKIEIAKLSKK